MWRALANLEASGWRQVGGTLYLTNTRLVFAAGRVDAALTRMPNWSLWRGDVAEISLLPRFRSVNGRKGPAAARPRLLVRSTVGAQDAFVVNRAAAKVEELRRLLGLS